MAHFQQTVTWVGLELDAVWVARGGGVTRGGGITIRAVATRRREGKGGGGAFLMGD